MAVVGVYALALAVANLAMGFAGGLMTVLAFVAAAAAIGLAAEMWYVSRRIERARSLPEPS